MSKNRYVVRLSPTQRARLTEVVSRGRGWALKRRHAQVLLKADQGESGPAWTDVEITDSISYETVRQVLKKSSFSRIASQYRVIPPRHNAAFVACMEDVLDLYQQPYDPKAPVTERRTRVDRAKAVRALLDSWYPKARVVRLVLDNLNPHRIASLYEASELDEARRLARRLEIHYTPIHGSWLNNAEIELRAPAQQCLDRRMSELAHVQGQVASWERRRNETTGLVCWQFTTADARIRLQRPYPQFEE